MGRLVWVRDVPWARTISVVTHGRRGRPPCRDLRPEWELVGWEELERGEGPSGYYRSRRVLFLRPGDLERYGRWVKPCEAVVPPWGFRWDGLEGP